MSEELQGLLKRIQEEGISKADQEKNEIITAAKSEADMIINDAKLKAEEIIRKATDDGQNTLQRGKEALGQASRDILIQLKNEMVGRMEKVVKSNLKEVMTPEFMSKIISDMVAKYLAAKPGAELNLEVMVAAEERKKMEQMLHAGVAKSFKHTPKVFGAHDIESGLKVSFTDDDVYFDFSDEALTEIICKYAGPRFAEYFNKK